VNPARSGGERLQGKLFYPEGFCRVLVNEVAVAGTENNRDVRPYLQHPSGEVHAGHARHGLIGDDEVKLIRRIQKS
jgi:hypothetical protein